MLRCVSRHSINRQPYGLRSQSIHSSTSTTTPSESSSSSLPPVPSPQPPSASSYAPPPFNTHSFFSALEKSFPTPIARSLMQTTRALLVNRITRVRREALTVKDLDNQAYLFRAAITELRSEVTLNTGKDSATIQTATTALRREVDQLDVKMKEDIASLKHEYISHITSLRFLNVAGSIQIAMDTQRNEVKDEFKQQNISIEASTPVVASTSHGNSEHRPCSTKPWCL